MNSQVWHCLILYGAPQLSDRLALWQYLQQLLSPYDKFLVIGDINQLDRYSDKLGGNALIRGWEDIISWKVSLNLHDLPFSGPRYTWTNNWEADSLIMERLDRGYASFDWLNSFPQTHIQNLPIIHSDHGPILLQTITSDLVARRPYQVENWSFHYPEVCEMVHDIWRIPISGSPAYILARRLHLLRMRLKS